MTTKILVAYASRHGATAEIAEAIANELRQPTTIVDLKSLDEIETLLPYDKIVLGSAVYIGQWLKDFVRFLEANASTLSEKETWLFSSGPTGEGDPVELMKGFLMPDNAKETVEQIGPKEVVLFHGELDMKKLNFVDKTIVRGVKAPVGDFRDWDMIKDWARKIIGEPVTD